MDRFDFNIDPITDLALPEPLETAVLDAIDNDCAARAAVEEAVNTAMERSGGWDGNWDAADVVRNALENLPYRFSTT